MGAEQTHYTETPAETLRSIIVIIAVIIVARRRRRRRYNIILYRAEGKRNTGRRRGRDDRSHGLWRARSGRREKKNTPPPPPTPRRAVRLSCPCVRRARPPVSRPRTAAAVDIRIETSRPPREEKKIREKKPRRRGEKRTPPGRRLANVDISVNKSFFFFIIIIPTFSSFPN